MGCDLFMSEFSITFRQSFKAVARTVLRCAEGAGRQDQYDTIPAIEEFPFNPSMEKQEI